MSDLSLEAWKKRGCYLIITLLLLALFKMPFGYYQILKVVVMAYFIIYACIFNKCQFGWLTATCWILAAIYNPFLQLHIGRGPWTVVNIITILFCVWLLKSNFSKDTNTKVTYEK